MMPTLAMFIGALLIGLGVTGYVLTGSQSPTALIPAAFGLILAVLGVIGRDERRRKHAMHVAVALALIGFAATVGSFTRMGAVLAGGPVARPAAVVSQFVMALLTGFFVIMGIRSFIAARRNRAL